MRTALDVVQDWRRRLSFSVLPDDIALRQELDLLLDLPRFVAFLGTIELKKEEDHDEHPV